MPLWILKRFLGSRKAFFNVTSLFAVFGITLGVACLIVVMAVVSGYETTLKDSLVDLSGHLSVVKRGGHIAENEKFLAELPASLPSYVAYTPFVQVEGMIAHNKRIAGVLVEGVEIETVEKVLHVRDRLTQGTFDLSPADGLPKAVVGLGVAKNFGLRAGDRFRVVRPLTSRKDSNRILSRIREFQLAGIVDFGKIEYNERVMLTDLATAQAMKPVSGEYSGIKIRLSDRELAVEEGRALEAKLGYPYMVRDWTELNQNLLEAIRLEKPVIFFVVLIMVIAACFNVCSHLFVSVLKKYSAISILRAMGATRKNLVFLFSFHGMVLGAVGIAAGVLLGLLMCAVFVWIQKYLGIVPGETYKLEYIGVELRLFDLLVTVVSAMGICFLSTLPPAIRGSRLDPVEGLRYE